MYIVSDNWGRWDAKEHPLGGDAESVPLQGDVENKLATILPIRPTAFKVSTGKLAQPCCTEAEAQCVVES